MTVISSDSGKYLGYRFITKTCKACESWESCKSTEEYELFFVTSWMWCEPWGFFGFYGSIAAGIVECFTSSEDDMKLRYISYIGDGDSKSYSDVVAHDPYHGREVKKLDTYRNVLGARLRILKTTNKSALSDGKPIGGKGRLTDKMINKLQNYFGNAIRQSINQSINQSIRIYKWQKK